MEFIKMNEIKIKYNDFQIGDQILERTKFNKRDIVSYLSALIRLFTNSYWNHQLFVAHKHDNGFPVIMESIGSGLVEISQDEFKHRFIGSDICIMKPTKPLTTFEKTIFTDISFQMLGVKYDYWGTLFFQLLYLIFGVWLGAKDTDIRGSKYCSESGMFAFNYVTGFCRRPFMQNPKMTRRENCLFPYKSGIVKSIKLK